jgi:hypothetical protein
MRGQGRQVRVVRAAGRVVVRALVVVLLAAMAIAGLYVLGRLVLALFRLI